MPGHPEVRFFVSQDEDDHSGGGKSPGSKVSLPTKEQQANIRTSSTSRPDLGLVGNSIRSQLTSDYEKKLFENYWLGKGDMTLTSAEFQLAEKIASTGKVISTSQVTISGVNYTQKAISFYGNQDLDQAYGTATLIYNGFGSAVGFKDTYDFNPQAFGVRPIKKELETRSVGYAGTNFGNAKDFKLCYGLGC